LKVRGFQVAPAELEGHILEHPDVADTCVVGIPDEYSGEVPLAFVVLSANATKRASQSEAEAAKIKASISKVRWSQHLV
jgi:acyl-coenzyme A synthetase/AMP-(fatty) acid ligase